MFWATSWVAAGAGSPVPISRKLPDPALGGQVPDGAGEERPVRPGPRDHLRPVGFDGIPGAPVGGVVVFTAQPVAMDPRRVRRARVGTAGGGGGHGAWWCGLGAEGSQRGCTEAVSGSGHRGSSWLVADRDGR